MARSGQKIVSPVTMTDIREILGVSTDSFEYAVGHAAINMWAKYKPVRLNSPTNIDQQASDGTWKSSSTWWRGDDGNCGLVFNWNAYRVGNGSGVCTDDNALPDALNRLAANIDGGNNGWSYERPYGGQFCPFRHLDFCGYNHAAPKPIRNVNITDEIRSQSDEQWTQLVEYMESSPTDITARDYITPRDVSSLSLRSGIAIYKRSGGSYEVMAWTTGGTWVGYGGVSESSQDGIIVWPQEGKCEANFKDRGTYYVLPLLFSRDMSQPERKMSLNNVGVYIVPVPDVSFYPFNCYFTGGTSLIAEPKLSTRQVGNLWRYNTSILFDSTDDKYSGGTFEGVEAAIVNSTWSDGDSFDDTTKCAWHESDGSLTVPNNQTVTWTTTGNVWLYEQTWRVVVRTKKSNEWSEWTTFTLLQPAPSE